MEISEKSKITRQKNIYVQELDGEAVLLNLNNNQYYSLDKIGLRMFSVLTSAGNIKEAIDTLLGEYAVEAGQLQQDIVEFVSSLQESGLVQIINE